MTEKITVLIADDHAVVREGLRALIATMPDMTVIGEAEDGVQAVHQARALRPDVILLDMMMPRMGGLESINEIKSHNPGVRILVLTSFSEEDLVFPAIKAGAIGYLLKNASPEALLTAIRNVYRGEPTMSPTIAAMLMRELQRAPTLPPTEDPLTEREVEVLRLLTQGMSNGEIAEQLVIGEGTVRAHVGNILSKLHLANRTQAALYALREGLAPLR